MTIEVHLCACQTIGFAAILGHVESVEVALLFLYLIGGINVEVSAAIAQTAGVSVEAAEVHVVRIVAIIIGGTIGKEVEVGILLHRCTLCVVTEACVDVFGEAGLSAEAEGVNAFHEMFGFLIERDVLVMVEEGGVAPFVISTVTYLAGAIVAVFVFGIHSEELVHGESQTNVDAPRSGDVVFIACRGNVVLRIVGNLIAVVIVERIRGVHVEVGVRAQIVERRRAE